MTRLSSSMGLVGVALAFLGVVSSSVLQPALGYPVAAVVATGGCPVTETSKCDAILYECDHQCSIWNHVECEAACESPVSNYRRCIDNLDCLKPSPEVAREARCEQAFTACKTKCPPNRGFASPCTEACLDTFSRCVAPDAESTTTVAAESPSSESVMVPVSRPPTPCETGCDGQREKCYSLCNGSYNPYCRDECKQHRTECWQKCAAARVESTVEASTPIDSVASSTVGACESAPSCMYEYVRHIEWCKKHHLSILPWNNDEAAFAACEVHAKGQHADCLKQYCPAGAKVAVESAAVSLIECPRCRSASNACRAYCADIELNDPQCLRVCESKRLFCQSNSQGTPGACYNTDTHRRLAKMGQLARV